MEFAASTRRVAERYNPANRRYPKPAEAVLSQLVLVDFV